MRKGSFITAAKLCTALFIIGMFLTCTTPAFATEENIYWENAANGNWSDSFSWFREDHSAYTSAPVASDSVFIINGATVNYDALNAPYLANLAVDHGSTLIQQSNDLVSGWNNTSDSNPDNDIAIEDIGNSGIGTHTQNGGTNTVGWDLNLGQTETGQGYYNLNGGTLVVKRLEHIGVAGTGVFTQAAGTYHAIGAGDDSGYLVLGGASTGNGTYNLNGGTVAVDGWEALGNGGTGTFIQTGGTHTTTSYLNLGMENGSVGTYELSGADSQLIVGTWEQIGRHGTGTFTQYNGTHCIAQDLVTKRFADGSGTFNLKGGTLNITTDQNAQYPGLLNNGTFNYTGGQLNQLNGNIENTGTFNIGTKNAPSALTVNIANGSFINTGTVTVSDATVTYTGTFENNGAYISDPSTNIFVDLVIDASGYLQGGLGDSFLVGGDFINNSTQTGLWNTDDAYLGFTGASGTAHNYTLGSSALFTWGTLYLEAGNDLLLSGATGDLYFDTIILGGGSSQLSNLLTSFNVNYGQILDGSNSNAILYSDGCIATNYTTVVPEPSSLLLLVSGLAGLRLIRRKK